VTVIQIAEVASDECTIYDHAAKMYNDLVNRGENPVDAAWLVDEHFGFTANSYHHREELRRDPLGFDVTHIPGDGGGHREPHTAYGDSIYDVEGPGVQ
jgi:hypothetical protein